MYAQEWEVANSLVSLEDPTPLEDEELQDDQDLALAGNPEDDEDDL